MYEQNCRIIAILRCRLNKRDVFHLWVLEINVNLCQTLGYLRTYRRNREADGREWLLVERGRMRVGRVRHSGDTVVLPGLLVHGGGAMMGVRRGGRGLVRGWSAFSPCSLIATTATLRRWWGGTLRLLLLPRWWRGYDGWLAPVAPWASLAIPAAEALRTVRQPAAFPRSNPHTLHTVFTHRSYPLVPVFLNPTAVTLLHYQRVSLVCRTKTKLFTTVSSDNWGKTLSRKSNVMLVAMGNRGPCGRIKRKVKVFIVLYESLGCVSRL